MEWVLFLLLVGVGVVVLTRKPRDTWAPDLLERWPTIAENAGGNLKGSTLDPETLSRNQWGWTGTLHLRPGVTAKMAAPQADALDSALGVRPTAARIEQIRERADWARLRVVKEDPHADPIPWPGHAPASILAPVELGPYETGEPCRVGFAYTHTLIVGMPDYGKSALESLLIANFVNTPDVEVWGLDFNDGVEFEPWKGALARLATTPDEGLAVLSEARELVHARSRQLVAEGVRKLHPTPERRAVMVMVDEQAMLAEHPKLVELEDAIGTLGRKVLVLLVAALQRGVQDSVGSKKLRQLCDNRFCLRVAEATEVDYAFDKGVRDEGWRADRLTRPGQFYVRGGKGLVRPVQARAYYLDDAAVRRAARSGADPRAGAPDVSAG